jgi:hypothetical protein
MIINNTMMVTTAAILFFLWKPQSERLSSDNHVVKSFSLWMPFIAFITQMF